MNEQAPLYRGVNAQPASHALIAWDAGRFYNSIKLGETQTASPQVDFREVASVAQQTAVSCEHRSKPISNVPAFIEKRASEISQEFGALVLSHSLKQIHLGTHDDPIIGGGYAEEMWYSFLIDEYGKRLASQDRKLKEMIQKNLLMIQEHQGGRKQEHGIGYNTKI